MSISRVGTKAPKLTNKPFPKLMRRKGKMTIAIFISPKEYTYLIDSSFDSAGKHYTSADTDNWEDYNEVLCLKND